MSGPLTKGALVAYMPTTDDPKPTITAFQFNPGKMVHTWSQQAPAGQPGREAGNPMAVAGMPGETFQFTIYLDADDDVVAGLTQTGAQAQLAKAAQDHGVSGRLAALEMLLYPVPSVRAQAGLLGTATASMSSPSSGGAAGTWHIPNSQVPVVLFVWGPKRVVPVRVTTLTITETLYDAQLNPTHAEAAIALRVLTPAELDAAGPDAGAPADTAKTAYRQTLDYRRQWAATDADNAPSSIIGMLP
jgi:hypothetical protein